MKEDHGPLAIKNWAAEDRPREKLLLKGTASLTDAELIAILLRSGTPSTSAVDVAKRILQAAGNDLNRLAELSVNDLMKIRGVGEAKAITVISALELGRRRKNLEKADRPKISSSRDVFELLHPELMDLKHEEFWVVLLNRANRVIRKQRISHGGVAGTVADPKLIFKLALEELASSLIVAHNHPSGNLTASKADIDLTMKLKEAARFHDMSLLDHLIISHNKFMSFADEGLL